MGSSIKKARDRSGWKPSPVQELLIRAALWRGDAARAAWVDWTTRVNFESLNRAERRLLPLVYLNLRELDLDPPHLDLLSEAYHYFSAHNQLVIQRAAAAVRTLEGAGLSTLLLKGMALIPLYYHDAGARPTRDIDILIPTLQAREALQLLYREGWVPEDRNIESIDDAYLNRHYSHTLRNDEQIQLDMHRHVLATETGADEDADFWSGAIPVSIEGVASKALNPADQLLHTCIHGSVWNVAVAPIRWVTDAFTILLKATPDWDRLIQQTEQRQCVLQVRTLLTYLRENFDAPIPDTALERLNGAKVSRWDRLQYEINVVPPTQHNTLRKLAFHYHQYRLLSSSYEEIGWHQRFPRFLRDTWGLEETNQVPSYMGNYVRQRFNLGLSKVAHGVRIFAPKGDI